MMMMMMIPTIITYCTCNFNGKYWITVGPNNPYYPGIRIIGAQITEQPLH